MSKRHARQIHKVFAASSKFGRFKNSNGRGHVHMAWFGSTNAYAGKKGILQPRCQRLWFCREGEDEFKFLEEDQAHHLGLKIYEERNKVFERFLEDTRDAEAPYNGDE